MTRAGALLIDLDDTLVVEEPAAQAAFEATARHAAQASGHSLDADALAVAARRCARDLWRAAPTHPYCRRRGISSWEGLWCRFEGAGPELARLRAGAGTYRRGAWSAALREQGVEDAGLAAELGERFVRERRARHEVFADARPVLSELRTSYRLALVTNGASCLQREKLAASGLADLFDAVVVAGDLGTAKPDAQVFAHALAELGASADAAVMVGDSLERDVDGAIAAGLGAVWLNRGGLSCDRTGVTEIATLAGLPAALAGMQRSR